jgi:hypothetical protein
LFSIACFVASAIVAVSGAPLERRATVLIPSVELWVITNPAPATIIQPGPGNLLGQVSIVNGNNEIDTIVSFPLGTNPAPTANSKCQFVIQGVTPTGSGIVQLFTLGGEVVSPLKAGKVPYYNQYEGQYNVKTSPSKPIDVTYVPCNFDSNGLLQYVIRPQNTDDSLKWTQSSTVGAFLSYTP